MAERSAKQLGLSKADLPNSILEVIATLNKGGFEAFIVGGGVRDTLLGLNPKDFDAVTDAKPHEIKDLFGKRCRIIGRRFQLAHVYSGRDMIEVATFRAPPNGDAHTTSDGMIVRDNVWGDIHQDFARRDFSINAMYYQPLEGVVHDFCNALDDIKNKTLRLLGHAPLRIEEDPVRLLRALRFKAKLGFDFDTELSEQFHDDNWELLNQVSPHRLYDESQKMFTGGYLVPLLPLLFEYGAIKHLIIYPPKKPSALVNQVAVNTDRRISQGKSINPAFFYAALLWDNYLYQLDKFKRKNMPFHDAQIQAAIKVIDRQRIKTAIPKFAEQFIRDIWLLQPKLANPRVKQITQLADHPRFRAAFDFLLLREQGGDAENPLSESTNGMGEWWQTYQTLSEKQKQKAINDFAGDSRRGQSGRSRNRNRKRNTAADDTQPKHNESASNVLTKNEQKQPVKATSSHQQSSHIHGHHDDHDAKERAQLKMLSLASESNQSSNSKQPSPLFKISSDKMAKQVPKQLDVDAEFQHQAKQPHAKKAPTVSKQSEDSNTQAVAKPIETDAHSESLEQALKDSNVVLLPKLGSIPAKRRRILPTQSQTQQEKLAEKSQSSESTPTSEQKQDKQAPAHKDLKQGQEGKTNVKPEVTGSEPTGAKKAKAQTNKAKATPKPVEQLKETSVPKSAPVPSTRRRRQPSSTKSVNERSGANS